MVNYCYSRFRFPQAVSCIYRVLNMLFMRLNSSVFILLNGFCFWWIVVGLFDLRNYSLCVYGALGCALHLSDMFRL